MRGKRLEVARRKAARIFKRYHGFSPNNGNHEEEFLTWSEEDIKRLVGIYRKTKVPCSCYMCGNPRRHHGFITMQEIRQLQDADEQFLTEDIQYYTPRIKRRYTYW